MELNGFKIKDFNVHGFDLQGKITGKVTCVCPMCSHTRKPENKKVKCATVFLDTGFYECHHECGRGQLHTYEKKENVKNYVRPQISESLKPYTSDLVKYMLSVRSISESTLKRFKIIEKGEWFSFPYYLGKELINIKSRTISKKFQMVKDAERIFYNLDSIRTDNTAIIVEGEFDVLAFYEAGVYNVVSVPNGFNAKGTINISYLDDYYNYFENKDKIILAVDNDEAGEHGKKELIRRFGAEKCHTVDFKDCKDANDYLVKHGKLELSKVIDNSKVVPLDNVETIKDYVEDLKSFYIRGIAKGYTTGIKALDDNYSTELGQFTVITGPPGCGKSEVVDAMCIGYAFKYGFKTAFASPENKPNLFHGDKLLRKVVGFRPKTEIDFNSKRVQQGVEFIEDNFYHVQFDGYNLKETLNKFEELVKRNGVRVFVIDPFNKIKLKESGGKNVTEYTNDYLNEVDMFCKKTQSIVHLVCHPVKMDKVEGTKTFKMPNPYNIKGGGEFYDMSYHILGFVRDVEKGLVRGETLKVKFQHLGSADQTFWLGWNYTTGRYKSIDFDPEVNNQPVTGWDYNSWIDHEYDKEEPKQEVLTPMQELQKFPVADNNFESENSLDLREAKF